MYQSIGKMCNKTNTGQRVRMMLLNTLNNSILTTYTSFCESVKEFCCNKKGVTAVEYAIVIAGVAAVVSVIFAKDDGTVANLLNNIFSTVEDSVISNVSGGSSGQ